MHCDFPKPTCTNIIVCIQVVVIWLCMYEAMHLVYDENHQIASMNQLCWGAVYRWTCSIRTHVCVSVYVYIYIDIIFISINRLQCSLIYLHITFTDILIYCMYLYMNIIYIHVFWILEVHMSLTYGGVTHTHTISPQKLTQICSHLTGRVAMGLQLTSTFDGKPGIMPRSIAYPGKRTPSLTCCFWDPHAGFTFFFGKIILHLTAPRYEWNFQDRAAKKSFVFPNSYGKAPAALNLVVRQLYSHGSAYNTET